MENRKTFLRKLIMMAMLSAMAYMLMLVARVPVVLFLKYEPKDVIITIGGFILGPMASMVISLVVSLVEMFTASETGPIGCLMNFLSTCSFACVAALIYKKKHTLTGAVVGLLAGSVTMIAVMLLWNWLVTPMYMEVPRETVEALLIPAFLPFNALKAGLNTAIVLCIYKPVTVALRKARLLPPAPARTGKRSPVVMYIFAGALLITCVLVMLVMKGIL